MTKEEILHLGALSRIKLSDAEVEKFNTEIDSILAYVDQLGDLVAEKDLTKQVGPVFNVFREDEVTNEPGSHKDDIVKAFPESKNDLLQVKKILKTDE